MKLARLIQLRPPKRDAVKTTRLPTRGGLRQMGKRWPENDSPPDKFTKPMADFNHPYHCHSCGHYFGGSFGGSLQA